MDAQILALFVVEAYLAATGAILWWLGSRREHRALRARINEYGWRR